jgi:undecaprenyl-diphosphatase
MISSLDSAVFTWLNSWAGISPFFDFAIEFSAVYLIYIIIAALVIFVFLTSLPAFRSFQRRNIEMALQAILSALVARFIIAEAIRFFYNRPRPFEMGEDVIRLVEHVSGNSFPSGHATFAFAIAAAGALYYPKTGFLFFLAAFLVGISRVAAGLHWPSDILGGALVGMGTAWFLHILQGKFARRPSALNS